MKQKHVSWKRHLLGWRFFSVSNRNMTHLFFDHQEISLRGLVLPHIIELNFHVIIIGVLMIMQKPIWEAI